VSGPAWSADARFALYYAPSCESAWWQAGSAWLGRDAQSGERCAQPQPPGLTRPLAALTDAPRRYGWHGTLVAPFRLDVDLTQHDVLAAARDWALAQQAFTLPVEAATLGDFVALRPADAHGDARIRELASSALQSLDGLRARASEADLARRLAAPLSERQRALLLQWGYPYVFDEFRFHMTLSNSLADAGERATLLAWWRERSPALGPLAVDQAALFVEPAPGEPFVLWQPLPFGRGLRRSDREDMQHDAVSRQ
jgi:putative phosphonate metabolism protein